ncbi:MraY family glycosyltransferase [Comamonas aquatica]|jgi:UDP-N-acetylmuramyl pentapeptide phosphotransferase/UDP-N-acetylglucosamine-1-phosphate transferase|uniref:MraY family glycosyltransferase n=1 Tax=Comamonas aquatica TaxID=225991 RepID=UPI003CFC0EF7
MFSTEFSFSELIRYDATVAFFASCVTCLLLVLTQKWHGSFSMDSSSGVQKVHTTPTPRIGGIGIAIGVFAGFAASSHGIAATEKRIILSSILLAGIPAFIFGLLEDLTKKISVKVRLFATMASGVLGWGITGTALTHVDIPGIDFLLGFTIISVIFTAIAVGGVANSINIIDGLNGLTAGTALIILTAFGIIARQIGDIPLAFTCLIIAGAVAGFFFVNWPKGKIFLGDGGAYFLGFTLAWIAVLLPERNNSISPWTSLLICCYPIIEVGFSILRRSLRVGHSPTEPDFFHLHSLANKRWARKIFSNFSKSMQNGLTAPFLWIYAAIPCSLAVLTYQSKILTAASFLFSSLCYLMYYRKLAFFRWLPRK